MPDYSSTGSAVVTIRRGRPRYKSAIVHMWRPQDRPGLIEGKDQNADYMIDTQCRYGGFDAWITYDARQVTCAQCLEILRNE